MIRNLILPALLLGVLISPGLTAQFTMNDVVFWTGTGDNQCVLLIDFNDTASADCLAWGYRFDGIKTAADMLSAVAANDPFLTINMNTSWLNDIYYQEHAGIGGNPDYWLTFSHMGSGLWELNSGLSTTLENGIWFGCTYTSSDSLWNPLFLPENPVAAQISNLLATEIGLTLHIKGNPVEDYLHITGITEEAESITLTDLSGRLISIYQPDEIMNGIPVSGLKTGMYYLLIDGHGLKTPVFLKFIKQ
jgi:hypothetical protein